ncbi:SRPBCC family protein [Nocardioides coralli]|uniref:SRPBCC family protein n=1 Tax=Nocardioides coralli TaxID=2872154 RepID=UPI001CA3E443|nr:SRPBCC family protein [Nocardioides coralli]QZY29742.1 SRPBCC family protein [Nocardioides coralli]
MEIQRSVETQASPDAVFAYLSDFTNTTDWDPGTVSTELAQGDGGVGSVYHNVSEFNGRKTELRYTVVEHQPPNRLVLRGENKTVTAVDTMAIEPSGSGTRVTYTADFEFKGLAKLVTPFLGGAFKKLGDEAEEGLREALAQL